MTIPNPASNKSVDFSLSNETFVAIDVLVIPFEKIY